MNVRSRRVLVGLVLGLAACSFTIAQYGHTRPQARESDRVVGVRGISQHAAVGGDACAVEYADAEFFIEINATAGDAGVQLMLDGTGSPNRAPGRPPQLGMRPGLPEKFPLPRPRAALKMGT